jgi:hypothetical protein
MSEFANNAGRVSHLAWSMCDGVAREDDFIEMDAVLLADQPSRNRYLDRCWLHVALKLELRAHQAVQKAHCQINRESNVLAPRESDAAVALLSTTSSPSFLTTTLPGTTGWFSSGWPVAYLIATLVVGIGLWISSVTPALYPQQIAKRSSSTRGIESAPEPQMVSVGRITGMAECRWARDVVPLLVNDAVPVGREIKLESGLMQITYDTGAKVILQGPTTYEVESAKGGYLSVGKLTARIAKKAEKSNPQSLIPNPLFAVRTPTATVADLGTEFGVEVSREGTTAVHVLQGVVEARPIGVHGTLPLAQHVTEGQAIAIGSKAEGVKAVAFAPQLFTRQIVAPPSVSPIEAAYIKAVLADKPMGYWPLNERVGDRRFVDRSGHRIHGYAMGKLEAGQPGPFGSSAVKFDGDGYIDLGCHHEFAMKNNFTVEAWVWIGKVKRHGNIISAFNDGYDPNGWGLTAGRKSPNSSAILSFGANKANGTVFRLPTGEMIEGRWLHVAVVFDRDDTAHLYLDGDHRISMPVGGSGFIGPAWLAIGAAEQVGSAEQIDTARWRGRIAHVAVYPHVLNAQQIENHYRHGNDGRKELPDNLH